MIELGAGGLDRESYARVVHGGEGVTVPESLYEAIDRSREAMLAHVAAGAAVYGVTTGLGRLAGVVVDEAAQAALQHSLLTGRACGLGPPLPKDVVRGAMLLRLSGFLSGAVGVSAGLCRSIADRVNDGWEPVVPGGPYGAAGEIGALAHLFQTLAGEGRVVDGGTVVPSREALRRRGVEPYAAGAKEGLALINGSPFATALGIEATARLRALLDVATVAAALHVALTGESARALAPRLGRLANDPSQTAVAQRLADLLEGSGAFTDGPQPPVSTRVVPQVHGASLDAVDALDALLERRLRAVTDSPLFLEPDAADVAGIVPSGAFHAIGVSIGLETLSIACAHVVNLVEKRLHRLLDSRFSGLPEQLTTTPGVQAGVVVLHKTVVGLVADARSLAGPVSVHAADTSSGQEDVQAFTFLVAERLGRALDDLEAALACELVALRQAAWLRRPATMPSRLLAVARRLEDAIAPVEIDRTLSEDVEKARDLVRERPLWSAGEHDARG